MQHPALFLLWVQEEGHGGVPVKANLTPQRHEKGKGIFQVTKPTRSKFPFQKVLEPRSSDPKLMHLPLEPLLYSSCRWEVPDGGEGWERNVRPLL